MNCHSEKTNYRRVLEEYQREFLTHDFQEMADASGGVYDRGRGLIRIGFFGTEHLVDCKTGEIGPEMDAPDRTSELISILHYLNRHRLYHGIKPTGKQVTLKELPGGVAGFYPSFKKMADDELRRAFGYNSRPLLEAAARLGGRAAAYGDASVTLDAFPHIPVTLVVWEGDDEMEPSASVLFDAGINRFVHNEMVIGLGVMAAAKVIRAAAHTG